MNAISNAISGLGAATQRVNAAAERVSGVSAPAAQVEDVIELKSAQIAAEANIKMIKHAAEMEQLLVRLLDETV